MLEKEFFLDLAAIKRETAWKVKRFQQFFPSRRNRNHNNGLEILFHSAYVSFGFLKKSVLCTADSKLIVGNKNSFYRSDCIKLPLSMGPKNPPLSVTARNIFLSFSSVSGVSTLVLVFSFAAVAPLPTEEEEEEKEL